MVLEADQRGGEAHGDQKELEAGVHLCAGINILKQNEMITLKKLRQIEHLGIVLGAMWRMKLFWGWSRRVFMAPMVPSFS